MQAKKMIVNDSEHEENLKLCVRWNLSCPLASMLVLFFSAREY